MRGNWISTAVLLSGFLVLACNKPVSNADHDVPDQHPPADEEIVKTANSEKDKAQLLGELLQIEGIESSRLVWTGDEFAVVWSDDQANWLSRIDTTGKEIDRVEVLEGAHPWRQPSVVWSGSELGVTWTDRTKRGQGVSLKYKTEEGDEFHVYFQRLAVTGEARGSEVILTENGGTRFVPEITWNGKYALAWMARAKGSGCYLTYTFLAADGKRITKKNKKVKDKPTHCMSLHVGMAWQDGDLYVAYGGTGDVGYNGIEIARINEHGVLRWLKSIDAYKFASANPMIVDADEALAMVWKLAGYGRLHNSGHCTFVFSKTTGPTIKSMGIEDELNTIDLLRDDENKCGSQCVEFSGDFSSSYGSVAWTGSHLVTAVANVNNEGLQEYSDADFPNGCSQQGLRVEIFDDKAESVSRSGYGFWPLYPWLVMAEDELFLAWVDADGQDLYLSEVKLP